MAKPLVQIKTILWLVAALVAPIFLSAGCRSMGLAASQPIQTTQLSALDPSSSTTVDGDAKADAKIKALESFLARTEAYSLAPAGASMPATEDSRRRPPVDPSAQLTQPRSAAWPSLNNHAAINNAKSATSPPRVVFASIVEPQSNAPSGQSYANETLAVSSLPTQGRPTAAPVVKLLSIRSTPSTMHDDEIMADSRSMVRVNQPDSGSHDAGLRSINDLLEKLVDRAVKGQDVSAAWEAGLIHAVLRRPLDAGSLSHALSHRYKPLFLTTIDVVRSLRNVVEDNSADVGDTLDQLDTLRRMIAEQADPSIDRIAMCRQVTTFGVFEEMSMAAFVAGRATPTIVYSELENLSAQQDEDGSFRTELATRIEIFTAAGESVLSREEPKIVDHCKRHRRDFFIAQRITLPATMQPGDYVLKVFVEDKLAGRASEGSFPFTVGMRTASIRN